ncbi:MAG: hypothetical protein ACQETB_01235 [Halobacteriota archaeon]
MFPASYVRSHTPNSQLRDHIRPPVIYGSIVQAIALIGFVTFGTEMGPSVLLAGTAGPIVAAVMTVPDAGWVDAPLAGVVGCCLYLGAFLAYGASVASTYEYVPATWVFGGYVSTVLAQAIMLIPAFVFIGVVIGGVVGGVKPRW